MADIRIKQRLREGQAVGVVSGYHTSDMIDFLGQFGLDGIWIECEHGPVSWEEIGDMSRACDLWNMASIVRVTANEPWLITRTLDRGASGIAVPHVSTREAAAAVVRAAKFGPLGRRGMYGGRRSYGVPDYYQRANDETLVVILIEESEAIANLAEILTVDHIDVFFVAPADLAQSMGYTGQPDHPEVRAVIDRAIRQIVAAGRTAGALVTDETIDHYYQLGARFLLTGWPAWVARAARAYRQRLDSLAHRS
ncbi:MAG TPA: aldolase/citrate lyase family protein [Isosphaeraceae bacterium]|nr:aldolase/citrate lyase family protein [Isosphaeraceae bacterium]